MTPPHPQSTTESVHIIGSETWGIATGWYEVPIALADRMAGMTSVQRRVAYLRHHYRLYERRRRQAQRATQTRAVS